MALATFTAVPAAAVTFVTTCSPPPDRLTQCGSSRAVGSCLER